LSRKTLACRLTAILWRSCNVGIATQDANQWDGLQELSHLARAAQRSFIVFSARLNPTTEKGMLDAFYIPCSAFCGVRRGGTCELL
jgi:hypothetical protein